MVIPVTITETPQSDVYVHEFGVNPDILLYYDI